MKTEERLIYANEVIKEIDEIIGNINFSSPYQNDIHLIVEGLERARYCVLDTPAVDAVEVVHGQWKRKEHKLFGLTYDYVCSVCGCDYALAEYCYCPNCGACMDGGK